MSRVYKSPCGRIELREGRWQDVLADVERVDAVITDPPYSKRTHAGQRTGSSVRSPTIRTEHWTIIWSDHYSTVWHEKSWESIGWYVFAPVAYIKDLYAPRLSGDGPALGCEWITIARPKKAVRGNRAGSRPGWYWARGRRGNEPKSGIAGQKDVGCLTKVIRDYSLSDDLICDPCAGSGTTLLAAAMEGRRAIGAEMDPKTFDLAVKRLKKGYTPSLF